MSETRKLAAILVADVVGYSRLAGADEDRTLARLRGLRSDLIDPAIAAHHGRIVKRTGDGSIVEFRSVVDAVRCAIELQNGLIERNAGVPPERRIEFRVGVHLGDVVEESDGDLMGDGVNIAARLEGIAKPGAICLSEDAYRQVKSRLELKVSDLGPTQLKNIAEPVRVYSLQVGEPAQAMAAPQSNAPGMAASAAPSPKSRGFRAQVCARRRARGRASCGGRLRLAIGPRAAAHRLVDRRAQAQGRAAAFDRRAAVRESQRRSRAGLFRRRDYRRSDDRPFSSRGQLRHRPRHRVHLQGEAGRREDDGP